MKKLHCIFIILFLGIILPTTKSTPTEVTEDNIYINSKVIQIIGLFRHGARFEETSDFATQEEKKDIDLGELTHFGAKQMFELGQSLRNEYIIDNQFLSSKYQSDEVYFRSTNKNRTLLSAQFFGLGLYPETVSSNFSSLINKQADQQQGKSSILEIDNTILPMNQDILHQLQTKQSSIMKIPIHTQSTESDKFLYTHGTTCNDYASWRDENQKSQDWDRITNMYQKDLDIILSKLIFSYPFISEIDLYLCYRYVDEMISRYWRMETIPLAFQQNNYQLYYKLQEIAHIEYFLAFFRTKRDIQTISTPFFQNILDYMNKKITDPKDNYKFIGLFAHDTTIGMVLNALNLVSLECLESLYSYRQNQGQSTSRETNQQCIDQIIEFGAHIIFELRQTTDNKYFVSVRYNGKYYKICQSKSYFCPYSEFKEQHEQQFVDYDKECNNLTSQNEQSNIDQNRMAQVKNESERIEKIIIIMVGILIVIIVLFFSIRLCKRIYLSRNSGFQHKRLETV